MRLCMMCALKGKIHRKWQIGCHFFSLSLMLFMHQIACLEAIKWFANCGKIDAPQNTPVVTWIKHCQQSFQRRLWYPSGAVHFTTHKLRSKLSVILKQSLIILEYPLSSSFILDIKSAGVYDTFRLCFTTTNPYIARLS